MKDYLSQVEGVSGKPVVLFFAQHLRHAWLGGNKAIRQMTALCETRIAELLDWLSGAICPA